MFYITAKYVGMSVVDSPFLPLCRGQSVTIQLFML